MTKSQGYLLIGAVWVVASNTTDNKLLSVLAGTAALIYMINAALTRGGQ